MVGIIAWFLVSLRVWTRSKKVFPFAKSHLILSILTETEFDIISSELTPLFYNSSSTFNWQSSLYNLNVLSQNDISLESWAISRVIIFLV